MKKFSLDVIILHKRKKVNFKGVLVSYIGGLMKTKNILRHLQEFGNITSWEAIKEYGCTRLSAVIWTLRHKYNLDIQGEWINFTDRYGQNSRFVKYILNKEA